MICSKLNPGITSSEISLGATCENYLSHRLLTIYSPQQCPPVGEEIYNGSILDLGCGPGANLLHLCRKFNARRGVGTEPSSQVVTVLAGAFPEFEFYNYPSERLPFANDEFYLCIFRSVLHWVDRNYLLQTLGEAMRVTKYYLLISDFSPHSPYQVDYHHGQGYRTYKMDYRAIVEGTGFVRCVASFDSNSGKEWEVIRTSLFQKIPLAKAFPLRTAEDFE